MNAPTQNAFSASSRTASTATDSSGIGIANQPANDIPAPSPKPRELKPEKQLPTYVYQDFANAEPSMLGSTTVHERVPPHSLQSQKLPCKLAAMLSDAGEFGVDRISCRCLAVCVSLSPLSAAHPLLTLTIIPSTHRQNCPPSSLGCPTAAAGRFSTGNCSRTLRCLATLATRIMPAL